MFPSEKSHLEKMFYEILCEKTVALNGNIQTVRQPLTDEVIRKILSELSISTIALFEEELKAVFVMYMSENFKLGKIMLSWQEISLQ